MYYLAYEDEFLTLFPSTYSESEMAAIAQACPTAIVFVAEFVTHVED